MYIHACNIHTYIYVYVYVYVYICIYVYVYMYMYKQIYTQIHNHKRTRTHLRITAPQKGQKIIARTTLTGTNCRRAPLLDRCNLPDSLRSGICIQSRPVAMHGVSKRDLCAQFRHGGMPFVSAWQSMRAK